MNNKKSILTIGLLTFVNTIGFSILIPVLPFIVREYGYGEFAYGLLLSSYSAFQFIGSPLLGSLSDTYGRKPLLVISQAGTLLCWMLFAVAYFLPNIQIGFIALPILVIAIARIADGITGGNNSVANALLADSIEPSKRTNAFAAIGAVTGLGMMIGPSIGGVSSSLSIGYLGTAMIAIGLSLVTLVSIILFLEESLTHNNRSEQKTVREQINIVKKVRRYKNNKIVFSLIQIKTFFAFFMASYTSIIVFYFVDTWQFTEVQIGLLLLIVGFFLIINQLVVLRALSKKLSDVSLITLGLFLAGISMIAIAFIQNIWLLLPVYFVNNLGIALCFSTFKSAFSRAVEPSKQGEILGVDESIMSVASAIAPAVCGLLYSYIGAYIFIGIGVLAVVGGIKANSVRKYAHKK